LPIIQSFSIEVQKHNMKSLKHIGGRISNRQIKIELIKHLQNIQ
jgi:hypothetical protein